MKTKICTKCKEEKSIIDFYKDNNEKDCLTHHCKQCHKTQKQTYIKNNPWAACLGNARFRCNNPNSKDYKDYGGRGIKCLLTIPEIKFLWERDKAEEQKIPTINRKDHNENYTLDNCEFIEMGLNSAERNHRVCSKAILQFDKNKKFLKEWMSATEVEKNIGLDQGNISRNLNKNKLCYGYYWRFKNAR